MTPMAPRTMTIVRASALAAAVVAGLASPPSSAQSGAPVPGEAGLTGTLAKVARSGEVRLGYREDAPPFSFLDRAGRPVGYSLDLCNAIVEAMAERLGRDDLTIAYRKVTAETRLAAVEDGAIDLECGSTTATRERAEAVSFSPLIFVAGTKVLVPKGTRWPDFRSLAGKTIAVTLGTTNAAAIRALDAKFHLGVKLVESPDHEQSYKLLEEGAVDGFATDDILLAGLVARHKAQDKFAVAGELLSYEPYGIVYAHDDKPMEAVIDRAFRALVVGHEIDPLYDRWFRRRLPNGDRFAVPMSPQLENAWKAFETPIAPDRE